MTDVLVRDVPPETVEKLRERAHEEGKSMQVYLHELLARDVAKPSLRELMDTHRAHVRKFTNELTGEDIVAAIHEDRDR
jgi:antitoxin FitA